MQMDPPLLVPRNTVAASAASIVVAQDEEGTAAREVSGIITLMEIEVTPEGAKEEAAAPDLTPTRTPFKDIIFIAPFCSA